jgi:hypothetical protein
MIVTIKSAHEDYEKYINGKRVIFVGPSSIMIGRGLGEWIDSFDVVVRTNHFPIIMNDDIAADYGKKCHALYMNMQYYHKTRPLNGDLYKRMGIKWLCMKRCRDIDFRRLKNFCHMRVIQKSVKYVNRFIKTPLMGSIIIYDLSECFPAEICIAGVDFYQSSGKDYKSYVPGYIPDDIQKINETLKIGQGIGHDIKSNAQYMKDMYDRGMITMPDFIYNNLCEAVV